jgi:hypothetical protein
MAHPGRDVVDPDDARAVRAHAQAQPDEHAVLTARGAARRRLVREQVALAEHDRHAADPADRLDDVGVLADHRGDRAGPGEGAGERGLERIRRVPVLGPPVEVDDHRPGAGAARAAGVADDPPRRSEIDRPGVWQRQAVRVLGVGEEGDPDALRAQQQELAGLARGRRGARVAHAAAAERAPRRGDPVRPAVDGVVRGGAARVEPGPADRAGQLGRRAEARVAGGRARHERRLDVAEREVVAPHPGPDPAQHRAEVGAAVAVRDRARDDGQVRQEVAAHPDRDLPGRRNRRGGGGAEEDRDCRQPAHHG